MKKLQLIFLATFAVLEVSAQSNATYGLVRKNYYSTVTDPFDSLLVYEELDSSTIRLGKIDPTTGLVTNIGPQFMQGVNLTGSALNPFDSTFIFVGAGLQLQTFSLNSGEMINSAPLSNPISNSYFDNFRFNNSDSTMYGLARTSTYDPITFESTGEVFLAKVNTTTGVITQISPYSVAQGYALAGSAIDPHQMVYYFSTGSSLIGLDLYTGEVFNNAPIQIQDGDMFDNFAYSCADTAIYGLVRKNFVSYVEIPELPGELIPQVDSSTVRLGRIDPLTGIVSVISPSTVSYGGYSLNAGATIDQNEMVYYYNNGYEIIGVSLITGETVNSETLTYEDGQFFDLMRNLSDCANAKAMRLNPTLNVDENAVSTISVYPNPSADEVTISSAENVTKVVIFDAAGKQVKTINGGDGTSLTFGTSELENGVYTVLVNDTQVSRLAVLH